MARCTSTTSSNTTPTPADLAEHRNPREASSTPGEPRGRRFAEVLAERPPPAPRRTGRGAESDTPAPLPPPGTTRGTFDPARAGPATAGHDAAAPRALPEVALHDVQAAASADGASLQFVVEDGSLAGLRMAFFLRGDVLDLSLDASRAEVLDRLRSLEDGVRDVLAARGLELGRFDADGERGRSRDGDEPGDAREPAAVRRARPEPAGGGSERDYVR
jgi:hypothetical protein